MSRQEFAFLGLRQIQRALNCRRVVVHAVAHRTEILDIQGEERKMRHEKQQQ